MDNKPKCPVIVYSTKDMYVVVHMGRILEDYSRGSMIIDGEKRWYTIVDIVQTYKTAFPEYTIDVDTSETYESIEDALNEYEASYGELYSHNPFIDQQVFDQTINNDDNTIILNAPGITGNTIMNTSEKSIRRTAKAQALAGVGVSMVASVLHLGFQSAADGVVLGEALIKTRLLKFNKTVDEIVERRERKTKERQEAIVNSPESFLSKVKAFKMPSMVKGEPIPVS